MNLSTRRSFIGTAGLALVFLTTFFFFQASPTFAQFGFKKGSFTNNTGLGAQPKAVTFFWKRQDTADTFNLHIQTGHSFATGLLNERLVALAANDGGFVGGTWKAQSQTSVILAHQRCGGGCRGAKAELTSLGAEVSP